MGLFPEISLHMENTETMPYLKLKMCYHKFFTPTHSPCEENKFKLGVITVRLKWLYGLTQS